MTSSRVAPEVNSYQSKALWSCDVIRFNFCHAWANNVSYLTDTMKSMPPSWELISINNKSELKRTELWLGLFQAERDVPDDQHVRVVPVTRSGRVNQNVLILCVPLDDVHHIGPRVLDVPVVPPRIANCGQLRVVDLCEVVIMSVK